VVRPPADAVTVGFFSAKFDATPSAAAASRAALAQPGIVRRPCESPRRATATAICAAATPGVIAASGPSDSSGCAHEQPSSINSETRPGDRRRPRRPRERQPLDEGVLERQHDRARAPAREARARASQQAALASRSTRTQAIAEQLDALAPERARRI
jgi:hypothetical protein